MSDNPPIRRGPATAPPFPSGDFASFSDEDKAALWRLWAWQAGWQGRPTPYGGHDDDWLQGLNTAMAAYEQAREAAWRSIRGGSTPARSAAVVAAAAARPP